MAIDPTLASATLTASTRTNSTISKPTNTADGDFLLACLYIEADVAVTAPSGWSTIVTADNTGVRAFDFIVYYKRASSEGSNWTWTHASAYTSGWVWRLTGVVASGDPEDATRTVNWQSAGTGYTWNSITTATANSLIVGVAAHWNDGTLSSETMTERINVSNLVVIADVQAAAGASGNKTGTWSTAQDDRGAILLALKEATAGGATLTVNVNDTVTVAEAVVVLLTVLHVTVADTVTVAEAVTVLLTSLHIDASDTVTVAEAVALYELLGITVDDTVTVAEAVTLLLPTLPVSVADAVTVVDVPTVLLPVLHIDVADAVSVAEDVALTLISGGELLINVTDAVTVADTATVLLPWLTLAVDDAIAVGEAVALQFTPLLIAVTDAVTVAESVTLVLVEAGAAGTRPRRLLTLGVGH